MKTLKIFTLISVAAILFSSCQKGDTGAAGANGAAGNANVQFETYTVTSSSTWSYFAPFWNVIYFDPQFTSSIQSGGTVEVFLSTDGGSIWNALPTPVQTSNAGLTAMWTYSYESAININFSYSDGAQHSDPNTFYGADCEFKVVSIAPSAIMQHPNTNWSDYNQVQSIIESSK